MKSLRFFCILLMTLLFSTIGFAKKTDSVLYNNPIIHVGLPDPTVIKSNNGLFYLYSTGRNIPIYCSKDLLNWEKVGNAFSNNTRPNFLENGDLWAPDINYIKGKYVLYYTQSKWGEYVKNGIGVAISDKPEGPFEDLGKLFTSEEIGVRNSIDEFYFEDKGKSYLFWGSFYGIYGIELSDDGLSVKPGATKIQIAGTFMEATAIEKRNGYYYLFGSAGSCCKGADSKYHITYGRSKYLFGPYLTKDGKRLLENNYETLIYGNDSVAGPGHQSRLVSDDKGQDWLIYHGYLKSNPKKGRVIFLDRLEWIDGWPVVVGHQPSSESVCPYLN